MIAAEPTPAHDPGEGSLDDPSSGQGAKAGREELVPVHLFALVDQQSPFGNRERLDGLDRPSQCEPGPCTEGTAIVAVSPHQLEAGQDFFQRFQQGTTTLLIGVLGSSHFDCQQIALRIPRVAQ